MTNISSIAAIQHRCDGEGHADARHGAAALLLVESLIHGLIANATLSITDAVTLVDVAAEIEAEARIDRGDALAPSQDVRTIIGAISASLRRELGE